MIGQGEGLDQLMRSVATGRIVHALLIEGPEGTGKHTAASWIERALLCSGSDRPCGECPSCRKQAAGIHPDIHTLSLRQDKKQILVDDIRGLIAELSLRPYEGIRHIAEISPADAMNASAQNALLKTLEAPPGNTVFLLITSVPEKLLPTILSRCQRVRLTPLPIDTCAKELEKRGIPRRRASLLAGCAGGAVGRALKLDTDTAAMELRSKVIASLGALKRKCDVARASSLLAECGGREALALDWMEFWARDLMAVQAGLEPYVEEDGPSLRASGIDGSRLLRLIPEARRKMSVNVRWIYVLEEMYFSLAADG
ncbi:MAG: DNA polymerase III subunit delta' [Clostridia bacterium]|nr:DNA polymerase III subunit delta' [Clostridia bacterium]